MTVDIKNSQLGKRLHTVPARDLGGLMRLYESSYERLLRLLPEWPLPFEDAISHSDSDRPLYVTAEESCRYTSTLRLTYRFKTECQPDLQIKVYHDARLAEALSVGSYQRCEVLREFDLHSESALHSLWPANSLMDKWLGYLLQNGHGFAMVARPRQTSPAAD